MNLCVALRAWVRAARAAAGSHAFAEASRAYERAHRAVGRRAGGRSTDDADAAALYHEGALAAMVSGRNARAVDLARAAVDRLDPDTEARAVGGRQRAPGSGDLDLGRDGRGPRPTGGDRRPSWRPGPLADAGQDPRGDRRRTHASRRPSAGDSRLPDAAIDEARARRRAALRGARAQHPRHEYRAAGRLRRGPAASCATPST